MLVAGAAMGPEYGGHSWPLPYTSFPDETTDLSRLQAAAPLLLMRPRWPSGGGPEEGLAARTTKGLGEDRS